MHSKQKGGSNIVHPAQRYNDIRRIIFSTANDKSKGISMAFDCLEGYRQELGSTGYVGLKAELEFFNRYKRDYLLTSALDAGDHVDFTGSIDGRSVRFDVTTNINYKEYKDYEPFLTEGYDYRIALLDRNNFEVIDVLDLAFPRCSSCHETHAFPFLLTLGENFNRHGESMWSHDQLLLDVCPSCNAFVEKDRFSHFGLFPISAYKQELEGDFDHDNEVKVYAGNLYDYAKTLAPVELMGIAENSYVVTDQDGGGEWMLSFPFMNDVVRKFMPEAIESGIID